MSKIKFKISKILFPKDGRLNIGEYSIISCTLIKNYTPSQPIKLNKIYKNFSLLSYTPIIFNEYDDYVATVEEVTNNYGVSYKLNSLENNTVTMTEGDKRNFLETILSPNQVFNLYATYKDPYELIKNKDIEKLTKVKGIGEKSVNYLIRKYEENSQYTQLITELKEYQLTRAVMAKLLSTYKTPELAIKKVKENPYILADEVNGIGFKKADAIALGAGIPVDSPLRLEAFFSYFLTSMANEGNSWVQPSIMFGQITPNLNTNFQDEVIRNVLYSMNEKGVLSWNEKKTKMFLTRYYNLEEDIFLEIERLKLSENHYHRNKEMEEEVIQKIAEDSGFNLTEGQLSAVNMVLDNNVSLLIGYGGTGKSSTIKVFTSIFQKAGLYVGLCTLSGKASARIQEATGFKGSTIHRLLGYNPEEGFTFNKDNQLPYDVIIVDESSFVGGELFYSLIQAIKSGAKLVLVGDDKQLPAIGMCNVFFDMINSKVIPTTKLTQIHRQAQKSGIIVASKQIREGTQITKNGWTGVETRGELQDFTVDIYNNKLFSNPKILEWYKKYVKCLKDTFNTQIIVPMKYKGDFNTFELNNQIQAIFNPKSSLKNEVLLTVNGRKFVIREGDKVINRKNNYKAMVYEHDKKGNYYDLYDEEPPVAQIFNGFCGEVKKIFDNKIVVKFDLCEQEILFNYGERNNLELAYALTAHLFQGSQIENVIVGIDNGSYIMNTKELVYTAITRASKECVLVAEDSALRHSISTSQTNNRNTFLMNLLQGNPI